MKKSLAMLLAIIMLMSMVACGSPNGNVQPPDEAPSTSDGNNSDNPSAEEYTGPTGEITFSAWGSDNEVACDQKAVEAFMASHPGTKVNLEIFNDQYATVVETRYMGGQSPDVIYGAPNTLLKWIQEGMLMPITDVYEEHEEMWDEEYYATELYDAYYVNGDYYATPVGACSNLLFYNKTKLDEAGLPYPTAETTWEELAEMALATTNRDLNDYSLGMQSLEGSARAIPVILAHGGALVDDVNNPTKSVFNSPETVKALQWIQDAVNVDGGFAVTGDDATSLGANNLGAFMAGKLTFYITGVYDVVSCADITDFEWDIAPLPQTMQNVGDTAVQYCGYAVSAQTENPELAKEFAYFMTTYEAQKIMAETGLITTLRKDVARSDAALVFPGSPEHHSIRVDTLAYAVNRDPLTLAWGEMNTVFKNTMTQMTAKEITPEQCAEIIDTEFNRLLSEANGK